MAKIAVQQEERLRRARAVLTQVEMHQDVVGVAANISDSSGLGRGVYHTDGTIEGVGCDDVLGHSLGGVSENECYV